MGIYRFGRNFIHAHFIKPLLDFCAVNNPKLYEYIFYNISHKFRREDCGDAFFLQAEGFSDFVQLKRDKDFALKVPLNFSAQPGNLKVAAVVHIFYPELADEMKNLLLNIPCAVDVFISTNSSEKKIATEKVFDDFDKGSVTVKIFPNRGRDVAPAFIGFREIFGDYDVCVHLHTKKSLHAEKILSGWRDYLYENLLGSPEIVGGILQILSDERVGAVFPQHFAPIRVYINWGTNYLNTKNFLRRLNISVDERNLIEFPAGSMFWFKPKALAPLFDSGLTFDDFPEECGQLDGTLAHAIERAFLFIVESTGFCWIKVDGGGKNFNMTPTLQSNSQAELDANIFTARHYILKRC